MKILISVLIFVASAMAGLAQGNFVIDDLHVDVQLHKDGTAQIAETLVVTFSEPSHGIYRLIPTDYDTGRGTARRVVITPISVTDGSGSEYETKYSREGAYVKIRIGSADRYVDTDTPITYVITYTAFGMINWFDKTGTWEPSAEFYWNLTGDEWQVPISKSSFSMSFPDSSGVGKVRARVFAGSLGSKDSVSLDAPGSLGADNPAAATLRLTPNSVSGSRDIELAPNEGMNIVLSVPAKLIDKPTFSQQAKLFLLPNLGFSLPLIALL
ncbi:MAG TPA: DUF2207 domain-containing protein, partial [Fimbriimonadales bacterium]|nr:DUF2207 domain-containing protein [Fimbriimonadales bacterium]